MELQEFVAQSSEVVNELSRAIENLQFALKEVEERILQFINRIGDLMVQEVLEGLSEPFIENRVWVQGEEAVFDQVRTIRDNIRSPKRDLPGQRSKDLLPGARGRGDRSFYNPRWASEATNIAAVETIVALSRSSLAEQF